MIRTPRLLLRWWREDDLVPFAAINADPVVMRYFPAPMTRAQSDALVTRIEEDSRPSVSGCGPSRRTASSSAPSVWRCRRGVRCAGTCSTGSPRTGHPAG